MSPEAQRIAIAQACPKKLRCVTHDTRYPHWVSWQYFDGKHWNECSNDDPLNDLNAMHEAEKVILNSNQGADWLDYTNHLVDLTNLDYEAHATAAERAEAFLRTLGLWKE